MADSAIVAPNDDLYAEVVQFLYQEAEFLDNREFDDWLNLLAEDVSYRMPVRVNSRKNGSSGIATDTEIFSDDMASLRVRVSRLGTEFAWAETPPSRTRHQVTNIRVRRTDTPDELDVRSNILVYRNRAQQATADLFSGERQDVLRRVDGSWRLAKRLIILDQAVIGARHLTVFL